MGSIIQEAADLPFRVSPGDAGHVPHVGAVGRQKQVVLVIVGLGHLNGPVAGEGDPLRLQLPHSRRIDGVADLLPAGGGRVNIELCGNPSLFHHIFHNTLRHRGTTDIPMANKKHFYHYSFPPEMPISSTTWHLLNQNHCSYCIIDYMQHDCTPQAVGPFIYSITKKVQNKK